MDALHILLLTHAREVTKATNTGRLLENSKGVKISRIIWSRTQPDEVLLNLIEKGSVALLYPESEVGMVDTQQISRCDTFIIIDATWQEARKIYNRSPYLHHLPRFALVNVQPSEFRLRRNQVAGGLCTAECAIALLRQNKRLGAADELQQRFVDFNKGLKG